jgi:hypothetical protein
MIRETKWERKRRHDDLRTKQILARVIGIILIIAGLLFLAALLRYQIRLIVFGTKAMGEVVAYERTGKWGKPRVRVTLENGETIEFLGVSLKDDWLEVGDVVPVYYLAYQPTVGETATFRRFWMAIIIGSVLILICLGGGFWILRRWSRWWKDEG